jgi:hypothetical protein
MECSGVSAPVTNTSGILPCTTPVENYRAQHQWNTTVHNVSGANTAVTNAIAHTLRHLRPRKREFDVQRSTFNVQRAILNVRRSTVNVRRSTVNVRRSAVNSQRSTFNSQRSTFNVQQSTFNSQRSTFSSQQSTFDVQQSTFDVRRSMLNVQRSPATLRCDPKYHLTSRRQTYLAAAKVSPVELAQTRLIYSFNQYIF